MSQTSRFLKLGKLGQYSYDFDENRTVYAFDFMKNSTISKPNDSAVVIFGFTFWERMLDKHIGRGSLRELTNMIFSDFKYIMYNIFLKKNFLNLSC